MFGPNGSFPLAALWIAGWAFASPAMAQDPMQAIYNSCKEVLQLSDSGCDCVIAETKDKLNDGQIAFFSAAVSNDSAAMVEAQGKLTGDEMLELTEFMTVTPSTCQNQ